VFRIAPFITRQDSIIISDSFVIPDAASIVEFYSLHLKLSRKMPMSTLMLSLWQIKTKRKM